MADQSIVARLGTIAVQGANRIATGVVGGALVASVIYGGNLIVDPALNTAPSQVYGSGAYATYQEARLAASGSNTMTASIQVSTNFYSGATLDRYGVQCHGKPVLSSGSVLFQEATKQGITVGTAVRTHIFLSTGSTVTSNTGNTIKIPDAQYISFIGNRSGAALNVNGDCKLRVWTTEKYGR